MAMNSMRRQLGDNLVAITSLVVALSALGYNTWRNERTERNRNIRVAGIELLQEVGSLQQIIFYARFAADDQRGDPRMGWADVLTIGDLAALMPPDVVRDAAVLRLAWEVNADRLIESDEAFANIDGAIDALRQTALAELRTLH
jgi:hypothetical protein